MRARSTALLLDVADSGTDEPSLVEGLQRELDDVRREKASLEDDLVRRGDVSRDELSRVTAELDGARRDKLRLEAEVDSLRRGEGSSDSLRVEVERLRRALKESEAKLAKDVRIVEALRVDDGISPAPMDRNLGVMSVEGVDVVSDVAGPGRDSKPGTERSLLSLSAVFQDVIPAAAEDPAVMARLGSAVLDDDRLDFVQRWDDRDVERIRDEVHELHEEMARLAAARDADVLAREEVLDDIARSQDELRSLCETLAIKREELSGLEEQRAALKVDLRELNVARREAGAELSRVRDAADALVAEVRSQSSIAGVSPQASFSVVVVDDVRVKAELSKIREEKAALEEEVRSLKGSSILSEFSGVQDEVSVLRDEVARLEEVKSSLERDVAELTATPSRSSVLPFSSIAARSVALEHEQECLPDSVRDDLGTFESPAISRSDSVQSGGFEPSGLQVVCVSSMQDEEEPRWRWIGRLLGRTASIVFPTLGAFRALQGASERVDGRVVAYALFGATGRAVSLGLERGRSTHRGLLAGGSYLAGAFVGGVIPLGMPSIPQAGARLGRDIGQRFGTRFAANHARELAGRLEHFPMVQDAVATTEGYLGGKLGGSIGKAVLQKSAKPVAMLLSSTLVGEAVGLLDGLMRPG